MPRKRMIDPEFWSDEEIGSWSIKARLFYIGLWNFSDDEGRFKAHDNLLKSQIFPYDDKIDINKIKSEITSKIHWYEVNGLRYGVLCNFLKHQRIDRPQPSKLPTPPPFDEQSTNNRRIVLPNIREVKLSKDKLSKVNTIKGNTLKVEEVFKDWNTLVPTLPCRILNQTRRDKVNARLKEKAFIDHYKEIFQVIEKNDFLTGRKPSQSHPNFKANLDWVIGNDQNYVKVLEKRYDNDKLENIDDILKRRHEL